MIDGVVLDIGFVDMMFTNKIKRFVILTHKTKDNTFLCVLKVLKIINI